MKDRDQNKIAADRIRGSFRDPSGFVFRQGGHLFREVNYSCKEDYDHLMNSGLYASLLKAELLIPHEEMSLSYAQSEKAYKVLRPEPVEFISYPYEWCFSQLKDAAMVTLRIQREALKFGAWLKDSSAYNIQFHQGRPVLIDTLSFERRRDGEPWVAYRQFCQHFFAPLALMSATDARLHQLLRVYLDGIPLDLASRLLPLRSYLRFGHLLHIHYHAKFQVRHGRSFVTKTGTKRFNLRSLYGLIDSLEASVGKMTWLHKGLDWRDYYAERVSYGSQSMEHKRKLVAEFLGIVNPKTVWDLGANTGLFSRIASDRGTPTVAFDMDPACVETNYLQSTSKGEKQLLPLLMDLTNPSPQIGWENEERMSLEERGPADTVLALALIHHLAIANNLPLDRIVSFFKRICRSLIIEFVPKSDPMVQRLLASRKDIFPNYTVVDFEQAFGSFSTIRKEQIRESDRILYLMKCN